jgi:hypothetical protein
MQINIIYSNNSYGLTKDANIIKSVLKEHNYNMIDHRSNYNLYPADLNIFLEVLDRNDNFFHKYKGLAPKNILFPNPEWFLDNWKRFLPTFDMICCKTKDAVKVFSQHSDECVYTSFTSDNLDTNNYQKEKVFFHSAGKSVNKGTSRLISAWNGVNDILYLYHKNYNPKNPNIITENRYIPDKEFNEIRNRMLFHVYPTRYEGFGHNIWESMSTGAIIITTDAPPMNEYKCDFYAKSYKGKKHCQVYFNEVIENSLIEQINKARNLSKSEIIERSQKNKENFKRNDEYFRKTLKECIKTLL